MVKFLFVTGNRFGFSSTELRAVSAQVRNQFELNNSQGYGNISDVKHLTSMLALYNDSILLLRQSNDALTNKFSQMENVNKFLAQQLDNVYSLVLQNTTSAVYSSSINYPSTSSKCTV